VLGPASSPGVDMLSIIRKYHLPIEFPSNVLEEAARISEKVDARMLVGREDLRQQFIVTIDPDDARDFDDAIHVEKIDNGGARLRAAYSVDAGFYCILTHDIRGTR